MTDLQNVTPRLPVADLPRTLSFYRERLGFEPTVLWPADAPTFALLERGGARVGFFGAESGEEDGEDADVGERGRRGYAELYIEVSDARAIHGELVDAGVPVEWGPEVYSYGRRELAVRDPDGYLIIFTEPTEDPSTTTEPE